MKKINIIFAIDEGNELSGVAIFDVDNTKVLFHSKERFLNERTGKEENRGKINNIEVLNLIKEYSNYTDKYNITFVIEEIKSFGNIMGNSVINTAVACGRFFQCIEDYYIDKNKEVDIILLPRKTYITYFTGSVKGNDGAVRAVVLDLFGGQKEAKGTKKNPGIFYDIIADAFTAVNMAIYVAMTKFKIDYECMNRG